MVKVAACSQMVILGGGLLSSLPPLKDGDEFALLSNSGFGAPPLSVYLFPPLWRVQALLLSKVDEFVPRAQHVNLRIVSQAD